MLYKSILLSSLMLASNIVIADLDKEYKVTVGEKLAECVENRIPIMDRIGVKSIRSYTKYDKHYISLNSNSIYVNYESKNKTLEVMYINNNHIEKSTSAENAKQILQDISNTLLQSSVGFCSKNLGVEEDVSFSMTYVDPPYENRLVKEVITMDSNGRFMLP